MVDADEVPLVGGHVALDFANTTAWRLDEQRFVDRIPDPAALIRWAVAAGVLDAERVVQDDPASATRAVQAAHRLRTALQSVLDRQVDGGRQAPEDLEIVRRAWLEAARRAPAAPALPLRLDLAPDSPADVVRLLAIATADLLSGPLDVLRRCDGPGCGWFFLDHSRNRSRRWCRTEDCGNRARARRHYARVRKDAASPQASVGR